jgi:2-polyprenyl-3-methyl-5-hydroxy-6-metoxy-1,4-benzoquinol methylase
MAETDSLNAALEHVPQDFRTRISQVVVCDDGLDAMWFIVVGDAQLTENASPELIRQPIDLGYGGNQKAIYQMAIDQRMSIVLFLRGDSQKAFESLPEIVAPLDSGDADAVMGTRLTVPGNSLADSAPVHRGVGDRVLKSFENRALGTSFTDLHSGCRAYRVDALEGIQFGRNADGVSFDTQIIIQLIDAGRRIVEVPIPGYHHDESGYVERLKSAIDVSADVVRYRLGKLGFDFGGLATVGEEYGFKESDSSHAIILGWLAGREPGSVLDLGCSGGLLSERIRAQGHRVIGVDVLEIDGVRDRVDLFLQADLDRGLPDDVTAGGPYDVVVCADILEHVRDPERVLQEIHGLLTPGGVLIASVPNFGHFYARLRTLLGLFDYDQRGVLDNGHVRFFMRSGLMRRFRAAGYAVVRQEATGLPLDVLTGDSKKLRRVLRVLDRALVRARPQLFGYQFVSMCAPEASGAKV